MFEPVASTLAPASQPVLPTPLPKQPVTIFKKAPKVLQDPCILCPNSKHKKENCFKINPEAREYYVARHPEKREHVEKIVAGYESFKHREANRKARQAKEKAHEEWIAKSDERKKKRIA